VIVIDRSGTLEVSDGRPVVATMGNFDGLHVGHQMIMKEVVSRAREIGGLAAVVTFAPHPIRVMAPERAPKLLLTPTQKIALIERLGLDLTLILPFSKSLAAMPPRRFIEEQVLALLNLVEVYVGPEFRFGRRREGDIEVLSEIGREHGFSAFALTGVEDAGARISASRIRRCLDRGEVSEAARLLGRPYRLTGTIVKGSGRGHRHLVPTANLEAENEFILARGVYITRMIGKDLDRYGVTNIGVRPTFGEDRKVIETHLPGFEGKLYGTHVDLEIIHRLRDEKSFASSEALLEQIRRDLDDFETWMRAR